MPSPAEWSRRTKLLKTMMEAENFDALILSGNAEAMQRGYIRYLSDWRLWGGKGFIVFPQQGEPVLILGAGSQAYWAKRVGVIDDVRAATSMLDDVVEVVQAMGLERGKLGVVGMAQVMQYGDVLHLQRNLASASLIDATRPVDDIMAVKSEEELALAAETSQYIAEALMVFRDNLAPGRTERDVMAQAVQHLASRGCLDGIAHLTNGIPPFFRPPTERRFQEDDIIKVSLEFAGPSGYWIEVAGVFSFKAPPERMLRFFDTVKRATDRVQETLVPGAVGGDVTRAIESQFAADGWNVSGRVLWDGHLIGLNVIRPPFGLIESTDVFKENMLFNVHPGLVVDEDGFGMLLQDNLVVTPDGGKPIYPLQHEWHIVN